MIAFSTDEIVRSVYYSILYGMLYCGFISIFQVASGLLLSLKELLNHVLNYEKIFILPKRILSTKFGKIGPFTVFLYFIFYSIGFVLLSYLTLDGIVRIYMIIISSATIFLLKPTFYAFSSKIVLEAFELFLKISCVFIRIIILPVKLVIKQVKNKIILF